MTISWQVLGLPHTDNALLARIDTGQALHRLLFDCGDVGLARLPLAEIQQIDHLCLSHLHMDHIGGFDTFFRANFNRAAGPVEVWGPPRTAAILQHRFQGFLWNLHQGQPGTWHVHDLHPDQQTMVRFEAGEAFATAHPGPVLPRRAAIIERPGFSVAALALDHQTPSMAYLIREAPRLNVDPARLAALGLRPGPWLQDLKNSGPDAPATLEIDGAIHQRALLRDEILVATPGDSLAYLTDFGLDAAAEERLGDWLRGCATIVCEAQYRAADGELARRNHHLTSVQAAQLARRAGAGKLVLFHLSARYQRAAWLELLDEARAIFPTTTFPAHWGLA